MNLTIDDDRRFTLDGSSGLERRLRELCCRTRQAILQLVPPGKLKALVLGGGYGRGHGGVLRTDLGDAPYNDLEFYVFLNGHALFNELRYREAFSRLGELLSAEAGLHIEFKLDSLQKLRHSPVSIFSYDLVSGHRTLYGDETLFHGCLHHLDSRRIVPGESTRLLLNRGSGLLLVEELLLKNSLASEESDFIGRNLAKAKLAIGDALLAAEGKYHWDCRQRVSALQELSQRATWPMARQVLEDHSEGVRFKLHPIRATGSLAEFVEEHRRLTKLTLDVWLWLENHRLSTTFSTLKEYAFNSVAKCDGSWWRNLLLNIRLFGVGATLDRYGPRYPRERLFNVLPLLLGGARSLSDTDTRRHVQNQLRTGASDWCGFVAAYKQVWSWYG